jgi:hypothetical protein
VKQLEQKQVAALLLDFSALSKKQQDAFLDGLNRYLFVSPGLRQQLRLRWRESREQDRPSAVT